MKELCRILIVDDEILVRQGIKHYMVWEQFGFQIVGEASNGKEALELVDQLQPHIVITDIVMPIMDGEEFTRIVKQRYPHIEVIVLSSYGEFSYVRSTFQSGVADYILKPKLETQELLQVLQKTARCIPSLQYNEDNDQELLSIDHIIEKVISGYEVDYGQELIKQAFPYEHYCLIGVQPSGYIANNHTSAAVQSHLSTLGMRLAEVLESLGTSIVFRPAPVSDSGLIVFLINLEESQYSALVTVIQRLADDIHAQSPQIGWVMSSPFHTFEQIDPVYHQQILKLLDYRFYFPDRRLMLESELPPPVAVQGAFNLKQFAEEMKREHFEFAFQELRQYVTAMSGNYVSTPFELKSFLGNVVFNIITLLGNLDYDVEQLDAEKYNYFKQINEAEHINEAIDLLNRFLLVVDQQIAARTQPNSNSNMKKLLEYIDIHFAESLSLTGLGQYFHFNPSYLSSYFTTHNKEGFSEYLNKIRVEKAVAMLKEDEFTIADISSKVGYSDPSYFTKVFKKLTGLSPSQYRRKHLR